MPQFKHKPRQRHPAIAPLSRDHYAGLVQARRLMRAADTDVDDIERRAAVADFVDAWELDIAEHFADEERLLTPHCDQADRRRLLLEHEQLSELAQRVQGLRRSIHPDPEVLREAGDTLEAHIRWEERDLFPRLQDRLSATELAELERATAAIELRRRRSTTRPKPRPTAGATT